MALQRFKTRLPSNWRNRLELIEVPVDEFDRSHGYRVFRVQFVKGSTPKGFNSVLGIAEFNGKALSGIWVDQRMRRRGLGRQLLLYAIKTLGYVEIDWSCINPSGRSLFMDIAINHASGFSPDFWKGLLTIHA